MTTMHMKYHLLRNLTFLAAGIASAIQISAETFEFSDGTQIDGEIQKTVGEKVTIVTSDGSKVTTDLAQFDTKGQTAIRTWKAANPEKADVYTKWDSQPIIVSNKMPQLPERFLDSNFKGTASVELILDESGKVLHASVKNSSHDELNGPSIEATRSWKFEPAMVDGEPVKSKLRVPFQFSNTPPEKRYIDNFRPQTAFTL